MTGRDRVHAWLIALIFFSGMVSPCLATLLYAPACCPIKTAIRTHVVEPVAACCCCPPAQKGQVAAANTPPVPCCGVSVAPEPREEATLPLPVFAVAVTLPPTILRTVPCFPAIDNTDSVLPIYDEDAPRGPPRVCLSPRAPPCFG